MIMKIYCPFCDKEHEISIIERETESLIKNESVKYVERVYHCDACGSEFSDGEINDSNLLQRHFCSYNKKILNHWNFHKFINTEHHKCLTIFTFINL